MMNLTSGEWIPVVREDGTFAKVSLLQVYQRGDRIRDLAVRPHERIALMRLFICVAQAALDGPKDREDWLTCHERLPEAATDYLAKWRHAFELFGDGQRFLQVEKLVSTKGSDEDMPLVTKMDMAFATGSASTLFDNAGGSMREFSSEELALMLLAFQCFSSGGTLSMCLWDEQKTRHAGNTAGPCLADRMVHTFVRDPKSLLCSVWLNLLNKEQLEGLQGWGRPVWEMMPRSAEDAERVKNATQTYLGRMAPICRCVRLNNDHETMLWGCALDYPGFVRDGWRDPSATIFPSTKKGIARAQLSGNLARSLWRELHVISVVEHAEDNLLGGPFALRNACDLPGVEVYAGAVVHALGKTTTILDVIESVLPVPKPLFTDAGQALYRKGVEFASGWARRLTEAVRIFHKEFRDQSDHASDAATHYWTAIEQKVPLLLALVSDPTPLFPEGSGRENWVSTGWGSALAVAARQAYDMACPRDTARQLKAYTLGLNALFKPVEVSEAEDVEEENQE